MCQSNLNGTLIGPKIKKFFKNNVFELWKTAGAVFFKTYLFYFFTRQYILLCTNNIQVFSKTTIFLHRKHQIEIWFRTFTTIHFQYFIYFLLYKTHTKLFKQLDIYQVNINFSADKIKPIAVHSDVLFNTKKFQKLTVILSLKNENLAVFKTFLKLAYRFPTAGTNFSSTF